ncbi:MAG TPA: 3-oxoacyl-[acyl-carrier-protein] synthase III C-terminal domain-containing protein [Caulobacteraceae bacterium]|nr:3-oxoacyl-[acyl-carrier-protein] synthase III C-terminal domain-containing protein [Caulobacteraceae bacterium]
MTPTVALLSLATASPPHILEQSAVAEAARTLFGPRFRDFDRLAPVFTNAGIHRRQAVAPMEWHFEPKSWPERTAAYLAGAVDLFVEAAAKALARAGITAAEVDTVVTVSSTGIATPSLEARAMGRLGLRADVARVPVFGLGCAGGVTGLSLAARLAAARPGEVVLFVCVELCTLAFRLDELTSANLVATALFGDGAAACVVSAGAKGLRRFEGAGEHTWPDTLDIMGWNVDPQGFGVIFARSIPPFAEANLRPAVDGILARMGLAVDQVDRFVCHPGGAKVIDALESALGVGQGALDREREVLADHGNMSAPTAIFVLERVLADPPKPRLVLSALGPGFTATCLSLAA